MGRLAASLDLDASSIPWDVTTKDVSRNCQMSLEVGMGTKPPLLENHWCGGVTESDCYLESSDWTFSDPPSHPDSLFSFKKSDLLLQGRGCGHERSVPLIADGGKLKLHVSQSASTCLTGYRAAQFWAERFSALTELSGPEPPSGVRDASILQSLAMQLFSPLFIHLSGQMKPLWFN